ncbi:T6SS phospholipase effector Tle1-like catalytic domain-containing protein [Vibrio ouci]|uniref:DUF2235 domain-containing protein n=1 Tax=Vibrio ouci TaxID=2499078 RepID=A0A4Y8WCE6_9VIBR|nr:DUF2235 domain-containing protein [Vibrio ouci]TFH89961.1 DUF2235 domain-containing protein [Vibrio ouci]
MSIETGSSAYFLPCEQCNRWIEIFVRDEFNLPFNGVSGTLTDSAGNEFSVTLGEEPIYLEGLASGPVLLNLDSEQWLLESQKDAHKPNTGSKPTADFATEYVNQEGAKPEFLEITAGDLTELAEGQSLPARHEKGKADSLKLITDKSYVLQVRGFNFITLRVGMFFDGTGNNTYSAEWGKKELDKYYYKWRPKYEAECENIASRTGISRNSIPITQLSDDCFAYPQEKGFFQKLFTGDDGDTETVEGSATNELTNIQKLFERYAQDKYFESQNSYSFAQYVTGIGTGNEIDKKPAKESIFGQGTGIGQYGVVEKVNVGIEKLVERISELKNTFENDLPNVVDGISKLQFDVFGFSRGAASARHFVNVVLEGCNGNFAKVFTEECAKKKVGLSSSFDWDLVDKDKASCEVTFVGVFDTVASVVHLVSLDSKTILDFDFSTHTDNGDVKLWLDPERVRRVVHLTANSKTECRENFSLNRINKYETFSELTLPGAHSDIGGGYHSRHSYAQEDYLLPLLENKLVKKVSRSYSSHFEKERALKYVLQTLEEYKKLDLNSGWKDSDYAPVVLEDTKLGNNRNRVTGKLFIKRKVEGDLSRLYLRVMYGLAEFHGVPLTDDDGYAWTDDVYLLVKDLPSDKKGSSMTFTELNANILKLAKNGDYEGVISSLSTPQRLKEFMASDLYHHSSSDTVGMKPLFNESKQQFERASYECNKET